MIYGHGDNQQQYSVKLKADFSSNVRFDGCPEKLLEHLKNKTGLIANYPEPDGASLKKMIADKYGLNVQQVLICNGSSDGFYQIAQTFSGCQSAILYPSFSEYEDACRMNKHQLGFFLKEELGSYSFSNTDLVWFGNPNNPDGHVFDLKLIENLLKKNPNANFVIDEAFVEMSNKVTSAIHLLQRFQNLVICQSLTKTYGIPGLRLGYILGNEEIIRKLDQFTRPWSVNSLAIEAGRFILNHSEELKPDVQQLMSDSKVLQRKVDTIEGFTVIPSDTGFFLVEIANSSVADLQNYLLKHQLSIRDASNFRGLDEQFFRVGIQSEEKNEQLVKALQGFAVQVKPEL